MHETMAKDFSIKPASPRLFGFWMPLFEFNRFPDGTMGRPSIQHLDQDPPSNGGFSWILLETCPRLEFRLGAHPQINTSAG
jgi:hypothetical protein